MKKAEDKKGVLWGYIGATLFIAAFYTLINNNIDYSSGVPSYGSLSLTTSSFIGQFLGALLVPSIPAIICSFLTKRYKFEQLLFFIALFIYVMSFVVKVNLPLQYLLGVIALISIIFVIKKYDYLKISFSIQKAKSYLLANKKNITLSIILIPLIKVLLHFIFNPMRFKRPNRGVSAPSAPSAPRFPGDKGDEPTIMLLNDGKLSLEEHLYSSETGELIVFTESLYLYIPAVIIFAIFVWIFNDKIKAH